ncbi:Fe-S oxidoreductase [Candidatus Vecturithrix granuli]|uniref:Fe-S oxidoreductase n=1 Tax=Vecturithrix granuli TaxID=1499967 RepID=A0A081C1N4_VECG1|nr:Fe-S oxidoreductase [Candidatus Vecturithrix granuli]
MSIKCHTSHRLLLINPWIYDFAAFDLWMKPIGLLYLAGWLRQYGYTIDWLDCLDRYDPELLRLQGLSAPRVKAYGVGKFFRQAIPKPPILAEMPFPYSRYGISEDIFRARLHRIPRPDAVIVTSIMTYWYPAVFRVIELVKQHFPGVPVILGGIYAALCPRHATAHSHADYVLQERDPVRIIQFFDELTGFRHPRDSRSASLCEVYPAFDLYEHLDYGCLLTSLGCPYRCTYCASHLLSPQFTQREPEAVFQELLYWHRARQIQDFALYDDALLVNASTHLEPLLKQVIDADLPIRFHTPNGVHARYITERTADLMFRSGFTTLRLSLETTEPTRQQATGGKVTGAEFEQAVNALKHAGFQGKQIGVYLFVGLPGQDLREARDTIHYVHGLGLLANLCEYSPIPGTPDWNVLASQGYVEPEDDPLIHNNSVFLYLRERHNFEQIQILKNLVKAGNQRIKAQIQG